MMQTYDSQLQVVGKIDAVLLSYPDCPHLGALPYAVGKLVSAIVNYISLSWPLCMFSFSLQGLNCPIYATVPVYKMGQMFLYDVYQVGDRLTNGQTKGI